MVVEVDGGRRRCGVIHKGREVVGPYVGLVDEAVGDGVSRRRRWQRTGGVVFASRCPVGLVDEGSDRGH